MKKTVAYYFLLLYTASLCKPFTIWFSDALAHAYFSQQHAAVVHQHNGDRHVHYQIEKAAKEDAPEQKKAINKMQEDSSFPYAVNYLPLQTSTDVKNYYPTFTDALPVAFAAVFLPPPQAC